MNTALGRYRAPLKLNPRRKWCAAAVAAQLNCSAVPYLPHHKDLKRGTTQDLLCAANSNFTAIRVASLTAW